MRKLMMFCSFIILSGVVQQEAFAQDFSSIQAPEYSSDPQQGNYSNNPQPKLQGQGFYGKYYHEKYKPANQEEALKAEEGWRQTGQNQGR